MRSLITVFGTFFFAIFCEFFIRIVIIFYHQAEFTFYGVGNLPGFQWVLILGVGVFVSTWIASMLAVTIINFNPGKHLIALASLFFVWRLSEFLAMPDSEIVYSVSMILVQATAVLLALITKNKMNANTGSDSD